MGSGDPRPDLGGARRPGAQLSWTPHNLRAAPHPDWGWPPVRQPITRCALQSTCSPASAAPLLSLHPFHQMLPASVLPLDQNREFCVLLHHLITFDFIFYYFKESILFLYWYKSADLDRWSLRTRILFLIMTWRRTFTAPPLPRPRQPSTVSHVQSIKAPTFSLEIYLFWNPVFKIKLKVPRKPRPNQNSWVTRFWPTTHWLRNACIRCPVNRLHLVALEEETHRCQRCFSVGLLLNQLQLPDGELTELASSDWALRELG